LIEISERNTSNFFQNFSSSAPFSRNEAGNEKKQDLNIEKRSWRSDFQSFENQIPSYDDSNDRFQREKHLELFFRIFRPLRSLEPWLEVRKRRFKHRKTSLGERFESPKEQIPTYQDPDARAHRKEHLEFFQDFSSIPFSRNKTGSEKKIVIQAFKNVETQVYVRF